MPHYPGEMNRGGDGTTGRSHKGAIRRTLPGGKVGQVRPGVGDRGHSHGHNLLADRPMNEPQSNTMEQGTRRPEPRKGRNRGGGRRVTRGQQRYG